MDASRRLLTALGATLAVALLAPALARAGDVQIGVRFHPGTSTQAKADVLGGAGADAVRTLPQIGVTVVSVDAADEAAALRTLDSSRAVDVAAAVHVMALDLTPTDPSFEGSNTWAFTKPGFPAVWDATTGSTGITVAVVDSGVNPVADLAGRLLTGHNAVSGTSDVTDNVGHGTEVAGTVAAAGDNGIGVAGVCWSCRILPVKVADANGSITDTALDDGVHWAVDHGAQIINLSLGGGASTWLQDAITYAQTHGVLVVASAGNLGSTASNYPAAYPGVLSVAASDQDDARYSWSTYGSWVAVAAPGCVTTTLANGSYGTACGTSFAAPLTSGLAALLLSAKAGATAAQLTEAIESFAHPVGSYVRYGRIDALAALTAIGGGAPVPTNTALPAIAGTATPGQTLTGTTGTWTGAFGYAYRWQRCNADLSSCTPIDGAAGSSYTITTADGGYRLRLQVTASNLTGSASALSAGSAAVPGAPQSLAAPTVTGTAKVGQTLTGKPGSWQNATTTRYQWRRCDDEASCTDIAKATASNYVVQAADVGLTLVLRVTGSGSGGSSSADSAPTGQVAQMDAAVAKTAPTVRGEALVGATLTGASGGFTGTAFTQAAQWRRCDTEGRCTDIAGATGSTYRLQAADVAHTIVLRVTATNPGGATVADSTRLGPVAPAPVPTATTEPTVTGAPLVGQSLAGHGGVWENAGSGRAQWRRCDGLGTSCVDIAGATGSSYTVQQVDVGYAIVLHVSETNGYGATGSADSHPTAAAAMPPLAAPTTSPVVNGDAVLGRTLTAGQGSWNTPATLRPQWRRCGSEGAGCADIARATGWSYALQQADVGSAIVLHVTATNSAKVANGWDSAAVGPVVLPPAPANSVPPTITGTVLAGKTLTGKPGTWTNVTSTTAKWLRCTSSGCVTVGTAWSYALQAADGGATIHLQVTGSNIGNQTTTAEATVGPVQLPAPPSLSGSVGISGTAKVGATLTANRGTWTGATSIGYQWWRSNPDGSFSPIAGATGATYRLTAADRGCQIGLRVTAHGYGGDVYADVSPAFGPVAAT